MIGGKDQQTKMCLFAAALADSTAFALILIQNVICCHVIIPAKRLQQNHVHKYCILSPEDDSDSDMMHLLELDHHEKNLQITYARCGIHTAAKLGRCGVPLQKRGERLCY
eukprot:scaffold10371_cov114-Skeletonema_dohrnii-CCMP3373.AAC.3